MGLTKGMTKSPNGRPKGIPKKSTNDLRKWVREFIEEKKGTNFAGLAGIGKSEWDKYNTDKMLPIMKY